jgi:hypothetical protein
MTTWKAIHKERSCSSNIAVKYSSSIYTHPHKQSIFTETMFLNVRIALKAETKKNRAQIHAST